MLSQITAGAIVLVVLVICVGIVAYACYAGSALVKIGRKDIAWSETRFGDASDRAIGRAAIAGGGVIIAGGILYVLYTLGVLLTLLA